MKIQLIKDSTGRIIATNVEDDEADWEERDRQEIEENHSDYSMAFDLVMGGKYEKALKILFDLPLIKFRST